VAQWLYEVPYEVPYYGKVIPVAFVDYICRTRLWHFLLENPLTLYWTTAHFVQENPWTLYWTTVHFVQENPLTLYWTTAHFVQENPWTCIPSHDCCTTWKNRASPRFSVSPVNVAFYANVALGVPIFQSNLVVVSFPQLILLLKLARIILVS
jgi:hypothetical protein